MCFLQSYEPTSMELLTLVSARKAKSQNSSNFHIMTVVQASAYCRD